MHALYAAHSNIKNDDDQEIVTAYALRRPDGMWAVLILNKDENASHNVGIRFRTSDGSTHTLQHPIDYYQYGPDQFIWHPDGENGRPALDRSPLHTSLREHLISTLKLPPFSMTIFRGR